MSINIFGWVEVKLPYFDEDEGVEEDRWQSVINLSWLYHDQSYDSFGCFFDVRNYANFRPIAPGRGLPADLSPEARKDAERFGIFAFGQSWITWDEIKQIDWEEEGVKVDQRIHEYERNKQGELVYKSKALGSSKFAERVGYNQCIDDLEQEWDLGDMVFRRVRMKRKDIKESWEVLFHFLETLATQYGDDHIRLVVWFS